MVARTSAAPPERVSDFADQRWRCGDAKGPLPDRGRQGRDLGAASERAERSRDRAPARPCPGDREPPPGESGRDPTEGTAAPRELPEPRRARGDLARDRPRALGAPSPAPSGAPTRRSAVRSSAARAGALPRPRRRARGLKEGAAPAVDQARAAPGASPARHRAPQGGQLPPADRGLAQARIPRR